MTKNFIAFCASWSMLGCAVLLACVMGSREASAANACWKPSLTEEERQWISAHPVVNIAVEANWHPIEYIHNGKQAGLVAGYLGAISKMTGLVFKTVPGTEWGHAYDAFSASKVDLLPGVWRELVPDRIGSGALVSLPYLVGRLTAVTRNDSAMIFSLKRLEGRRVAIKGRGAVEYFTRHSSVMLDIQTYESEEEALAAVASGAADAALGVDVTILPIVRRQFPGKLYMSGMLADRPVSLAMLTRSDLPILASIIDKSLAAIPVSESAEITRDWVELGDYGKPTIRSIIYYRAPQVLALGMALLTLLALAYLALRSRAAAIRSKRDKAMFLAFVSHEIRTPMYTILSSLELLQRSRLTGKQANRADAAISASETLLTLLDDILEYSRLESSKVRLAPQTVELGTWARQTIDMVRCRADAKGLALVLDVACEPALRLVLDPVRVRQIVLNLLVNAIKFAAAGSVMLYVDFLPDPQGKRGTLTLEVRDNGIGIAPERLKRIFDAYWQATHLPHVEVNGSGLGLAICRELVKLMRGTIAVESSPYVETKMTVQLPIAIVDDAVVERQVMVAPVATDMSNARSHIDAPRILIVDDHEAVRRAIVQQCDELGCIGIVAATGEEAMQRIAQGRIDLILLDCNLPDIDGYALTQMIRQHESMVRSKHVPIIAISAASDDAHKVRCFDSGMDGVLGKPLRLQALRQMITSWCTSYVDAPDVVPADPRADDLVDLRSTFEGEIGRDFDSLISALLANDLHDALHAVHRIKGVSLVAGADAMVEIATGIEERLRRLGDSKALRG
ncbi:response regulator [Burkholderia arboris]|uniref:response regulator n=1 Tax=Burkholderia arboris TaxID=488730 RepID=UPI001CA3A58A|nr:response regulator [Burkholderia arboris]MBY8609085.1 response regulator [Burkholderia arboris]